MDSPKYNRTFHLPFSPGATNDDKIAHDVSSILNIPIVITEKIDGSNTSLEHDNCYARTHSGPPSHPSFDGLKALHSNLKHKISPNIQIFGEWCYALHSITYDKLPGYFLAFNVRDLNVKPPIWESWDIVELWAEDLGVPTVPVLFKGIIKSESELREITEDLAKHSSAFGSTREGIVIRKYGSFNDNEFSECVFKYVRKNHVNTSVHWAHQEIVKNKLKSG